MLNTPIPIHALWSYIWRMELSHRCFLTHSRLRMMPFLANNADSL